MTKKTILALALLIQTGICAMISAGEPDAASSPIVLSEFIFETAPFKSCHASTIAEARDGTLVAAWFAGSREGADDVAIWSSRLEPGADVWSEPKLVADSDDGSEPCWNPVLFQPKDGPLCLFYKQSRKITEWRGVLTTSQDSGKTWIDRRALPENFIGPVKNKPVQLDDGTILAPSSTEHAGWRVHFEFIPTLDKTWSRTEAINSREECGAIQPSILFHKDGRLQALCRNRDSEGKILQTWSEDSGKTWSKLTPTSLPNPCSGTDAVTLRDGRQLLVYNHTTKLTGGRNILNVAVSDDGIEWRAVAVLEKSAGEYSYPAVIQTRDGMIHIVYTWRRERIRHVVLDPENCDGVPIVDGRWPESVALSQDAR